MILLCLLTSETAPKSAISSRVSVVRTRTMSMRLSPKDGRAAVTALDARSGFCSHQWFMEKRGSYSVWDGRVSFTV